MGRRSEQRAYARSAKDVVGDLDVDPQNGLSADSIEGRRREHGPNRLKRDERRSVWSILIDQLKSIVLLILLVAAGIALVTGQFPEAIAVLAVLVVNMLIAFFSEWRATRSMEALRQTDGHRCRVRRDGEEQEIQAEELVPGDIVLLSGGDLIPADLRIVESSGLRANEAVLTGEAVPSPKRPDPVDDDAPLAEHSCMLYKGTGITEGQAEAVVVAVGMNTELGQIADMAGSVKEEITPLQARLNKLGARLAALSLIAAVLIAVAGLIQGRPVLFMIKTAIALGIAAVPEGLPIVATIALARGMWLMAKRNVIVNRLKAVEVLGSTTVIMTDKTGTLTENQMTVKRIITGDQDKDLPLDPGQEELPDEVVTDSGRSVHRVLELGVLCNNATLHSDGDEDEHGDPMELALLQAGAAYGMHRNELLDRKPEEREESFDPDTMMMATFHQENGEFDVCVKGAPAAVLEHSVSHADEELNSTEMSDSDREQWLERADQLASKGYRLLAMADRTVSDASAEPYDDLRFIGFTAFYDPPREGVAEAVDACQAAGIRVAMITGDKPETAVAIGRKAGVVDVEEPDVMTGREVEDEDDADPLLETQVFARVSPKEKLDIVELFMDKGEIVAVTGDGVNDAPALKKANIGIAMGQRGTETARQMADMVLRDDAFSSIVAAVKEGRVIFRNIRKAVMFMLCTNVAEVLAVGIASLVGAPLPLRPLQILFLNVLTDVFPALALGMARESRDVTKEPPRDPDESILTTAHWKAISGWSSLLAACVLAALWLGSRYDIAAPGQDPELAAVTVSFLTLAFGKLWFVFNLRDRGSTLLNNGVVRNPWIWCSFALCAGLLLAGIYFPPLAALLETQVLNVRGWGIVLGMSLVPFVCGQFIRAFTNPEPAETQEQ